MNMRARIFSAPSLCFLAILGHGYSEAAGFGTCDTLESQGKLLHQKFRASKICTESTVGKGWTDCVFRADGTQLRLVGAIGPSPQARVMGFAGSGLYVDSVDSKHTVRILLVEELGLTFRVDHKDNLSPQGCIYNEAYISLGAQVLSSGDLNMLRAKLAPPQSPQDRIRTLQDALIGLGYMQGPATGTLDQRTKSAMAAYRKAKGISADVPEELVTLQILIDAMEETGRRVWPEAPEPQRKGR